MFSTLDKDNAGKHGKQYNARANFRFSFSDLSRPLFLRIFLDLLHRKSMIFSKHHCPDPALSRPMAKRRHHLNIGIGI